MCQAMGGWSSVQSWWCMGVTCLGRPAEHGCLGAAGEGRPGKLVQRRSAGPESCGVCPMVRSRPMSCVAVLESRRREERSTCRRKGMAVVWSVRQMAMQSKSRKQEACPPCMRAYMGCTAEGCPRRERSGRWAIFGSSLLVGQTRPSFFRGLLAGKKVLENGPRFGSKFGQGWAQNNIR